MPVIYINDSGGNTWRLGADPDGRVTTRLIGAGQPTPPIYKINPSDFSTGNTWQLGIDTDGRPNVLSITYDAAQPLSLEVIDVSLYTWTLQVTAAGAFELSGMVAPSIVLPKIVYPSSVSGLPPAGTSPLYFQRQPRKVPNFVLEAVRHDNRASSGVQEVVYERTDQFFEGEMEYVAKDNLDIDNWKAFLQSALQGNIFDYYPDPQNSPSDFTTYFADDKKTVAAYKFPNQYSFKMQWYQYVAWP